MPPVRAIVALHDFGLHQVVEDILEITFREVEVVRAMSILALRERLGQGALEFDLLLLDTAFEGEAGEHPLAAVRRLAPELLKRTVLIVQRGQTNALPAGSEGLSTTRYPFCLDEFIAAVRAVRDRSL